MALSSTSRIRLRASSGSPQLFFEGAVLFGSPHLVFEGAVSWWLPSPASRGCRLLLVPLTCSSRVPHYYGSTHFFFEGAIFKWLVVVSNDHEQGTTSSPPGGPLRVRRAAIDYDFHVRGFPPTVKFLDEKTRFPTSSCSSFKATNANAFSIQDVLHLFSVSLHETFP